MTPKDVGYCRTSLIFWCSLFGFIFYFSYYYFVSVFCRVFPLKLLFIGIVTFVNLGKTIPDFPNKNKEINIKFMWKTFREKTTRDGGTKWFLILKRWIIREKLQMVCSYVRDINVVMNKHYNLQRHSNRNFTTSTRSDKTKYRWKF